MLALALLSACGGGGGSGSAGGSGAGGGSATYTIGGSVTGLTASSGVVLLDNGGNALSVPANATGFTFTTPLASGNAYAVTVGTQPTGETCTVNAGSGAVSDVNITSVAIGCTSSFATGAPNVVSLTVGPGAGDQSHQTFNIPQVTVTICEPGTQTCATVPNVLVDTGSSGLRLFASVLSNAGLSLAALSDPQVPANTIQECLPFADGYAWGAVAEATVSVGGETSRSAIPIQIINDSSSPSPAVPSSCQSDGTEISSVNSLDANGMLGVGFLNPDCGADCASNSGNNIYFSCPASGLCSSTTLAAADQVENPTASFATDNNGVIVQLAPISAQGATTGSGYLVFGIGTQSNNGLGGATVLTADTDGQITTTFNGNTLGSSFIDSGSNGLYFNDSALATCGASPPQSDFYCPNPTTTLSATNQGANGATSSVSFQVADLATLSTANFAIDDVAGPASSIPNFGAYFDWGLPFFYGRTVFVALDGHNAAGITGPYFAY